jgi:monofunctional biosynthetic peptidoglycan transglycosylase
MLRWPLKIIATIIVLSVAVVLPWRWLAPPTTSFMVQDNVQRRELVSYQWLDMAQISPHLAIAVIASEDQKFPHHFGFDISQIQSVLNGSGAPVRGASTITQQLAKNLYLWPGKSYLRKGLEAWLALWIELLWPKQRILEVYLNVVEFGPAVYGAGAASQLFFQHPARHITPTEAGLLAAVLPSPKRMSAARPSAYVKQRGEEIQQAVRQLGGVAYLSKM